MAEQTMIQIHLKHELLDAIKVNAANDGVSMAQYIAELLGHHVPRPGSLSFAIAAAIRKCFRTYN